MTADLLLSRREHRHSRLAIATLQFILLLIGFLLLRVILFLKFGPPSFLWIELLGAFGVDFPLDLLVASIVALPVLLWLTLLPRRWYAAQFHGIVLRIALFGGWAVFFFGLVAEYYFFDEFKSRFNTVAVDYLLFPHEVFINIWDAYPVGWVVGGCALFGALVVLLQSGFLGKSLRANPTGHRWWPAGAAAAGCVALYFSVRVNESAFIDERVIREIANNGQFAFVSAAVTRHLDYGAFYKTLPRAEAFARARRLLTERGVEFVEPADGLQRRVSGSLTRPRLNVILLLEDR